MNWKDLMNWIGSSYSLALRHKIKTLTSGLMMMFTATTQQPRCLWFCHFIGSHPSLSFFLYSHSLMTLSHADIRSLFRLQTTEELKYKEKEEDELSLSFQLFPVTHIHVPILKRLIR